MIVIVLQGAGVSQSKFLFIEDKCIYALEQYERGAERSVADIVSFNPGVFVALDSMRRKNFKFVIVVRDDYSGSKFISKPQLISFVSRVLGSQGIVIDRFASCSHEDGISCESCIPRTGLVHDYLVEQVIDRRNSAAIGSHDFAEFAGNLGINYFEFGGVGLEDWSKVASFIESKPRVSSYDRKSTETSISLYLNLDDSSYFEIDTGINFLNHLLEQVAKHSGIGMKLTVKGDLHIDDHHTVEDIGIVVGNAIREALGDKFGINRFGFVLPLDEARSLVAIDICNRTCCVYTGHFKTEMIGDLSTQMIPHFFQSFAEGLRASLHVEIQGENSHHMAESAFKALGRALKQAVLRGDHGLPSTKGLL